MDADQRRLKLVGLINKHKNIGVLELSIALNVSDRTIRNDKNYINSLFKFPVISSEGSGYYLQPEVSFSELHETLSSNFHDLKKDVFTKILMNHLFEEEISLFDISEMCYISETTVYNLIKDLNKNLKKHQVYILISKDLLKIKGEELAIRNLAINNVNNDISVYCIKEHIDKTKLEKISKILFKIEQQIKSINKNTEVINEKIEEYKKIVIISYVRNNIFNKGINFTENLLTKLRNEKESNQLFAILEIYNLELYYLKNVYDYLFDVIDESDIEKEIELMTEVFTENDVEYLKILKEDKILIKNLALHLHYLIKQHYLGIKNKNELLDDIKREFPLSFEIAFFIAIDLKRKLGLEITEDEIGFISLHG